MSREIEEFMRRNDRSRRNLRSLFAILTIIAMVVSYDAWGEGIWSSLLVGFVAYVFITIWWVRDY